MSTNRNPFTINAQDSKGDAVDAAAAKKIGVTVPELLKMDRKELVASLTTALNKNVALTKPKLTAEEISNDRLFRSAMADIGKPKKLPDPLPTPTTSFYKNSVTNGQTQIGLLKEIKTALNATTTQTIEIKDQTGKVVSTYTVENGVNG